MERSLSTRCSLATLLFCTYMEMLALGKQCNVLCEFSLNIIYTGLSYRGQQSDILPCGSHHVLQSKSSLEIGL